MNTIVNKYLAFSKGDYIKKNLTFEERESNFKGNMNQRLEKAQREQQQLSDYDKKFADEFRRDMPPGSVVWQDGRHTIYGTTINGKGIYHDPHDPYVHVNDIYADGVSMKEKYKNDPRIKQEYRWSALLVEKK